MLFTKTWLNFHVSDHSASSHRQEVIQKILFFISTTSTHGICDSFTDVACNPNDLDCHENMLRINDTNTVDVGQIDINNNGCNNNDNNVKDNNDNFNNINEQIYSKDGNSYIKDIKSQRIAHQIQCNQLQKFLLNLATDLDTENMNIFMSNPLLLPCQNIDEKSSVHMGISEINNLSLNSNEQLKFNDKDDNICFQFLFLASVIRDCRQSIFERPGKFLIFTYLSFSLTTY